MMRIQIKYLLLLLIMVGFTMAKAQSTRDVAKVPNQPPAVYQNQPKEKRDKVIGRWFSDRQKVAEKDYQATVKSARKARKKADKLAEKPQFKDPTYFGHKKPPVKRPPGKQKYCKECELRH